MTFKTVLTTSDDRGVMTVTLNRPEKHNAINAQMIAEMTTLAAAIDDDESLRVVVLTGQGGKSFCAGGDLNWMRDQIAADEATKRHEARSLAMMLQAWNTLSKPVIGRINGNAFGGGVGMCSICDIAIGTKGTKFGLTETKLGLTPATIGPYVVARMGEARARRVYMNSKIFDDTEAVDLGILACAVQTAKLDAAVEAEVTPYLSCKPGAVADAKALARSLGPVIDDAVIERTIDGLITRWQSPEAAEGIKAFFDK